MDCLRLEVVQTSAPGKEYAGSTFAAEDEGWRGCAEFAEAFEMMKKMV